MFVRSVFEGIRSGVCECVHRKRLLVSLSMPEPLIIPDRLDYSV